MNTSKLDLDIQDRNSVANKLDRDDIFNLVDTSLPVQYREDWIRLIHGLKLPKARKETIVKVVLEILKEKSLYL